MTSDEQEIRLAADVREALGNGPPSTAEALVRVMQAVRAAAAMPASRDATRRQCAGRRRGCAGFVRASISRAEQV